MWKKLLLIVALILFCQTGYASPLQDFSSGRMALDVNWKPHSFRGGNDKWELSGTVGLSGRWALNYRQLSFDPRFEGVDLHTNHKELNLLYKINPNFQLYAGYSRAKGREILSGLRLPQHNTLQGGIIGIKNLGHRTTLYTILGGGSNSANVEFGVSYQMGKNTELTATYRHLEFKKIGAQKWEEDFRGFGIGFTYKF